MSYQIRRLKWRKISGGWDGSHFAGDHVDGKHLVTIGKMAENCFTLRWLLVPLRTDDYTSVLRAKRAANAIWRDFIDSSIQES